VTEAARQTGRMPDLDAILGRVPALAGAPRTVAELPGGLTNRNYKVTTPDGAFVARLWSQGDLLAINRDHEYHNSVAAAQAGVGAPVLAYHPDDSLMVLSYIDGHTFDNDDVSAPGNIARIALACPAQGDAEFELGRRRIRLRGGQRLQDPQRALEVAACAPGNAEHQQRGRMFADGLDDFRRLLAGHRRIGRQQARSVDKRDVQVGGRRGGGVHAASRPDCDARCDTEIEITDSSCICIA